MREPPAQIQEPQLCYFSAMATDHTPDHKDIGVTHIALPVISVDRSIDFYSRYVDMQVVHRRTDHATGHSVVWLSDLTRPFVLVLIEATAIDHALTGTWSHIGVGVRSREEVDRRYQMAQQEGRKTMGPFDYGYPVGYWVYIVDPDGHNVELSFGQEVGFTVEKQQT